MHPVEGVVQVHLLTFFTGQFLSTYETTFGNSIYIFENRTTFTAITKHLRFSIKEQIRLIIQKKYLAKFTNKYEQSKKTVSIIQICRN